MSTKFCTSRWDKNLAVELFDVVSLLKHLQSILGGDEFSKALTLLDVTPEKFPELLTALDSGQIKRERHSFTPNLEKGEEWTKPRIIRTFEWVNRFRGDLWRLVAQILDLARLIGASAKDLQEAGHDSGRFDGMETANWGAILKSSATSLGQWGSHWDPKLFEKHIHGQSSCDCHGLR